MPIIMTYDGMPLILPNKELKEYAHNVHLFSPSDYLSANYTESLKYSDVSSIPEYSRYSELELGQLYWPVGARRYAAGFFLVTSENLEKMPKFDVSGNPDNADEFGGIRASVNHPRNGYRSKSLYIRTNANEATFDMWMLPPRPLFNSYKKKGLWVLPLVDDRYWWWYHTAGTFSFKSCTTWEDLYKNILGGLGYATQSITVDTIDRKYLFPNKAFLSSSQETRLPILLDAIGRSTNTKLILKHDSSIHVMNASNSLAKMTTRTTLKSTKASGGFGSLASFPKSNLSRAYDIESEIQTSETGLQDVTLRSRDTPGLIPSTITFMVNNTPYKLVTTSPLNPIGQFGDDTTNSASLPDSYVHYYTSTDGDLTPPATFTRKASVNPDKGINVPVKANDKAYDLRKNLIYTATSVTGGGVATWSEPSAGSTVLSKYFMLNISSYKASAKSCPVYAQLPLTETEAVFNKRQMTEYMEVFRDDWVKLQMGDANLILNGVEEIPPSGMHDYVIYQVADTVATKVVRAPYNDPIQDIYIESYLGDEAGCDSDTHPCGTCKGMQSDDMSFGPLIGRGIPENFLPFSPIKVRGQSVPSSYEVTTAGLLTDYPWYHTPPYVAKFCLGSATGTAALDFHFLVPAEISVYWDGQKVASRKLTGNRPRYGACSDGRGRISFGKTTKTPTYAIVVVDTTDNTSSATDSNTFKKQNWAVNMRCVDSQPFPPPLDIYCQDSSKPVEVPAVIILGMFTPPQSYVPGQSLSSYTTTTVCDGSAPSYNFKCNGTDTTIPDNLVLTFETPPASCSYLKDVVIDLQKSATGGGWSGVLDGVGPLKKLIIANLRLSGTEGGATLRILDLLDGNKELVSVNNPMCVTSAPFKMQFLSGNLNLLSCVGTTTKIIIKEA